MAPKNLAPAEEEVIGDYERERAARIRENKERMQKLGILNLAQTLSQSAAASSSRCRRKKPVEPGSACGLPPPPSRRSTRLKSMEPVSYREVQPTWRIEAKKEIYTEEQEAKEEIYTEEHDKLLGKCNTPWTLKVDGYDKGGKCIFGRGQICHQCLNKTLRHHTSCCKCQRKRGQLCGDCLYRRYGENVLEVKKNPKWTCPSCRGICNCAACRTKKGWLPTGHVYSKVVALGYKSVAHFLVATRRASSVNSEDSSSVASTVKECSNVEKVAHISGQSMDEHTTKIPEDYYTIDDISRLLSLERNGHVALYTKMRRQRCSGVYRSFAFMGTTSSDDEGRLLRPILMDLGTCFIHLMLHSIETFVNPAGVKNFLFCAIPL